MSYCEPSERTKGEPLNVLVESVDFFRLDANRKLDPERRSDLGQYMTPPATALLMASMFVAGKEGISLLDAGAGVGSLTAAFVSEVCGRENRPKRIEATVYEIDLVLAGYLRDTLKQCEETAKEAGVEFTAELIRRDFIDDGVRMLRHNMFEPAKTFDCAILNPPYKKINSESDTRFMLREVGVETSNLYTGFLSVVLKLLAEGGEMVAITPRSFCNGPYFKPFRKLLLETLTVNRVHVFESRHMAFSDDEVLQENVILCGVKGSTDGNVTITSSQGPDDDFVTERTVPYTQLVSSHDPDYFIHIVPDEVGASVARHMKGLQATLGDLDLEVSTGRVVDFRATRFLREASYSEYVPLIYPRNFENGYILYPKPGGTKPHALAVMPGAEELLVPRGTYVLVKRFTSKEEDRRVVAAVYDPDRIRAKRVGFENHTNFYHRNGEGIPHVLAKGLAAFLNCTVVDMYFRQFNGHTQVNATDLRSLRYPTARQLETIGAKVGDEFPAQEKIDQFLQEEVFGLSDANAPDPVRAKKKLDEALEVLKALGVPREQQNERSALTLLSLLDLKPEKKWLMASAPLMGITPMMDYFSEHYGKRYAPNTRETVRRQTVHQFLEAGIVNINPDDPERPTNSPYAVYQIESGLLELLKTFGTSEWKKGLKTYLTSVETLKKRYAQEREMKKIPIEVAPGKKISLTPGGQNILIERIIEDFCPRFTPGAKTVYVGDTGEKWAYFDEALLKSIGVDIEGHGKMPDAVVYMPDKKWLVLIEAVTSHGPVNPKRRGELKTLFKGSKAGLVYVTAFLDRHAMMKYLDEISWETEVWCADSPSHLIHFNGERFLGPYEK